MQTNDNQSLTVELVVFAQGIAHLGVVRSLEEAGYRVRVTEPDKVDKLLMEPRIGWQVFLLFLPGDVFDDAYALEKLENIVKAIRLARQGCIVLGDKAYRSALTEAVPYIKPLVWLDKPVEAVKLRKALTKIVRPEEAAEKKKVLIVDDDPAFAKILRSRLADLYRVSVVLSGAQALTFLGKNAADLILLDYEMPVMSGPQLLQALRERPETKDIPVIFLTGIGGKEAVMQVLALKPEGYILKSSSKEDLLLKMEEILHLV